MLVGYKSSLDKLVGEIGNTSIIRIPTTEGSAKLYAKCEWENPNGSIKDRAAYAMLRDALKDIPEEKCKTLHIIEYSGGNLAISLAAFCKELGIKITLVLSSASSKSIVDKLSALGAELVLVEKDKGFLGVMQEAIKLSQLNPESIFLYQHENESNYNAHKSETGTEILKQLNGINIDAWIASIGTGGTLMGVYDALEEQNNNLELHAVTPAELHYGSTKPPNGLRKYAGSGGLGNGVKQKFVERQEICIKKHWHVSFQETLTEMKKFKKETGIKIGTSAAANLKIAREVAQSLGPDATVVTVFPDAGSFEEWEAADNANKYKQKLFPTVKR